MLQFSLSIDEKTNDFNWVGNISPAIAIKYISQYMEETLAATSKELKALKEGGTNATSIEHPGSKV